MFDAYISNLSPAMFHLTNVILHAIASCLVYVFIVRLGYKKTFALPASIIFAIHPVLAQNIAWIAGRVDIILVIFIIPAFITGLNFVESKGNNVLQYILHIFFFSCALLTKESTLVFPVIFFIYLTVVQGYRKEYLRRYIITASGWVVVALIWLYMRSIHIYGTGEIFNILNLINIFKAAPPAMLLNFGKIFMPFNLSVYPILKDSTVGYGVISIIILCLSFYFSRGARPSYIFFGLTWFLIFALPNFLGELVFYESRMYIWSIGLIIVVAEIDLNRFFSYWLKLALYFTVVACFVVTTYTYLDNFKDRYIYWQNAVGHSPDAAGAHMGMAANYFEQEKLQLSKKELIQTLQLDPTLAHARCMLAIIYWYEKNYAAAENQFQLALKIGNSPKDTLNSYAGYCYSLKRYADAELLLKRCLIYNDCHIPTYKKLIQLYYNQGRYSDAEYFIKVLKDRWKITYTPRKTEGIVLQEDFMELY
jgi:Tfp pilus assembly protein PilF